MSILNLKSIDQNYTLSLTGNNVEAGFDRTHIAEIVFVEDRNTSGGNFNDLVKVNMPGLDYGNPVFPAELEQVAQKVQDGALDYFKAGKGIDPVTHFPYDALDSTGTAVADSKFTQPTLIGFYLQILADVAAGYYDNGMTRDQALAEMNTVLNNLLSAQTNFGWKGLLPWLDLDPTLAPMTASIGLGDNANLAQSIAVALGSLLSIADYTAPQLTAMQDARTKAEQFLDNQAPGYTAFVDPSLGIFRGEFTRDTISSITGNFTGGHIDRLANEFRGAIAFLKVRYPSLPSTVWTGLVANQTTYTDRNGVVIKTLAYYDGSAFQAFWPSLRNNERDFIGFRNALDNAYAIYTDYSFQNHLPGFVSAAQRPNGVIGGLYEGRIGISDIAEGASSQGLAYLQDIASTYALINAGAVDPFTTLTWLNSIEDQLGLLSGPEGFFDSARSNSEIAKAFIGIDIASALLSLSGGDGDAFNLYLKNRNLETAFNLLYDQASQALNLGKAAATIAGPPELADRSKAVFSHISSEGIVGNFPNAATDVKGATYNIGTLAGGFGGKFWTLDQDFNGTASQLVINYSAVDTPQDISIELKDGGDNLLFQATVSLVNTAKDKRIVIQLPNTATLATLRKVLMIVNQNATGDASANFTINSIDFMHLPSSQNLTPSASLGSGDVSTLAGNPQAQLFSSNPASSLDRVSPSITKLNYNISNPGDFTGFSVNFDPTNSGATTDLSALPHLVFGIDSAKVDTIRMEIEDNTGKRAVFYIKNIDVTRSYYDFLTSLLTGSIDATKVKKINLVVDQSSITAGEEIGNFQLELFGIQ